ncbi:phosphate propanoyltransferase [Lacticaseibacillus sp. GG6-2]
MNDAQKEAAIKAVLQNLKTVVKVPIGISNHHIHLTEAVYAELFPDQAITVKKPLNQPGEFASTATLTVKGPRGTISHVRVLGPCRAQCQVEISATDARTLGVPAVVRLSGDVADTPGIDLQSEVATVHLTCGVIVAKRHIHMSDQEASLLGFKRGDTVAIALDGPDRHLVYDDVEIRPGANFKLEMHVDTDEANAANLTAGAFGRFC